ncbi:uncharacterized protein ARMOST_20579 [Armillaria ostoyae]|uniref:Uncharacterized protein n=1 Tax=Armillaria ostoyae TaxID=47428 RepID=A0A284S7Q4_ARMOS|nr:uncharacterized protein ARMOST_20579 [Armillaria ostoyae]
MSVSGDIEPGTSPEPNSNLTSISESSTSAGSIEPLISGSPPLSPIPERLSESSRHAYEEEIERLQQEVLAQKNLNRIMHEQLELVHSGSPPPSYRSRRSDNSYYLRSSSSLPPFPPLPGPGNPSNVTSAFIRQLEWISKEKNQQDELDSPSSNGYIEAVDTGQTEQGAYIHSDLGGSLLRENSLSVSLAMADNTYRTTEPASILWTEQAYNAAIYIGAIAYGAQLVIAYLAIYHVLYGKRQKFARQYIAYITLLVIVSTAYTAGNIHACELAWIDERNFPGGPPDFLYTQNHTPPLLVAGAAAVIITFLADVCLLWRCYVVYHNKRIVVVLPALILFSTATMGVLYLTQISSPHSSLGEITIQAYVAYRSLSVTFNILVTSMMVVRLLLIRKRIRASLGPQYGRLYTGLAALMIESALPHTVVSILLIGLYRRWQILSAWASS